jgi:hypothetical protein
MQRTLVSTVDEPPASKGEACGSRRCAAAHSWPRYAQHIAARPRRAVTASAAARAVQGRRKVRQDLTPLPSSAAAERRCQPCAWRRCASRLSRRRRAKRRCDLQPWIGPSRSVRSGLSAPGPWEGAIRRRSGRAVGHGLAVQSAVRPTRRARRRGPGPVPNRGAARRSPQGWPHPLRSSGSATRPVRPAPAADLQCAPDAGRPGPHSLPFNAPLRATVPPPRAAPLNRVFAAQPDRLGPPQHAGPKSHAVRLPPLAP